MEDKSDVDELQLEKEKFLRLFAEFENYKKRTARERIELFTTASEEVITSLLSNLDDFDRAGAEIEKNQDNEIFKGVILMQIIMRLLHKSMHLMLNLRVRLLKL